MINYEAVKYSIVCGAFGDMIGSNLEFERSVELLSKIDPLNIIHYVKEDNITPKFTDDTQMTLFTLEGLVRAALRQSDRGMADYAGVIRNSLMRWYVTQGGKPSDWIGEEIGLIHEPLLQFRAAPGQTCLQALSKSTASDPYPTNDSKGCGTIMRVAPVGMLVAPLRVREVAIASSKLTHGHPTALYSASLWAELLAAIMQGNELEAALITLLDDYRSIEGAHEVTLAAEAALTVPLDGSLESVMALGEGWVADECLSIALYSCLYSQMLQKSGWSSGEALMHGIFCAARHPGDSDSTAAVAGNMLGLLFPPEVVKNLTGSYWSMQVCEQFVDKLLAQHCMIFDAELSAHVDREFIAPN